MEGYSVGLTYLGKYVSGVGYVVPDRIPVVENCIFNGNGTGISIYGAMSPVIRDSTFTNNTGSGIYMKNYIKAEITGNYFENNGYAISVWYHSEPVIAGNTIMGNRTGILHAWWSHSTITGNSITGNSGNGIYAVSYSSPLIRNNVISSNGGDGLWLFLNWPRAHNNTIVDNAGNGLAIQYYGSVDTRNNIIAYNGGLGTYAGEDYYRGYPRLYYNDIYGNAAGNTSPYSLLYEGNIFVDPEFKDHAAGDYQLVRTSPCIDAGDPDPAFNDPDGSRNDMGAYGGQHALPKDDIPLGSMIQGILDKILVLPDNAFKNEQAGRKETMENKLDAILKMIEKGNANIEAKKGFYLGALKKLENDLLAKSDGHFGGNPNNDWITSYDAQSVLYPLVVDLVNEVQLLYQSL